MVKCFFIITTSCQFFCRIKSLLLPPTREPLGKIADGAEILQAQVDKILIAPRPTIQLTLFHLSLDGFSIKLGDDRHKTRKSGKPPSDISFDRSFQLDAIDIYLIADINIINMAASIRLRQDISFDKPKLIVNQITFIA
ncbi:hypothetical protein [Methylotuvimicrobium sp. KM1]|uniref:hypothetical protein n=1 Tax=Methylotuvimicrobium sp. KM1 TaxID=3377707 RepID=UPI0038511602